MRRSWTFATRLLSSVPQKGATAAPVRSLPRADLPERQLLHRASLIRPVPSQWPQPAVDAGGGELLSGFSANRPVIVRDDLFGRDEDLARVLSWVVDQRGSALIYGPRGYGKTSLARVVGEIADSGGHVVIYASCSRMVDFTSLMQLYLREVIPAQELAALGQPSVAGGDVILNVHQVADALAGKRRGTMLFIMDEYDRIERQDTRESIVELVKDLADLNAPVQFLLVGVAADAAQILGYHPSVNRCLTCIALGRVDPDAIADMFVRKAVAERLIVPDVIVAAIVRLVAGSVYHAQLIGQKLAGRARRSNSREVGETDLVAVIAELLGDAIRIDPDLGAMCSAYDDWPEDRPALLALARAALADARNVTPALAFDGIDDLLARLRTAGIAHPADARHPVAGPFINAFAPQILLMHDFLASQAG